MKFPKKQEKISYKRQGIFNISKLAKCISLDCIHINTQSPGNIKHESNRINNIVSVGMDLSMMWIFLEIVISVSSFTMELLVGDSGYGLKTYPIAP